MSAPTGCQFNPNTIEFGVLSKVVELLSNTAQRANISILNTTGGLFINDIHTRWGLRVAVGGDAVKDSSLETRCTTLLSLLLLKKSSDVFFSQGNIFDSLESLYTKKRKNTKHDMTCLTNFRRRKCIGEHQIMPCKSFDAIKGCKNAPFCLCDHARFGHFCPAQCKLSPLFTFGFHYKTPGSFQARWKGFTRRASRGARSLYSSLPEWHSARGASFAAAFGPNPPGSLDNLISSWRCGEQVLTSWCCSYSMTGAWLYCSKITQKVYVFSHFCGQCSLSFLLVVALYKAVPPHPQTTCIFSACCQSPVI